MAINIDPANKGKFTRKAKRAHMSVMEYAERVMNADEGRFSPATRRQANFARNARRFKH